MPCGVPRSVRVHGLALQLYEWGESERPPLLLLHSLAAHSHWWDFAASHPDRVGALVIADMLTSWPAGFARHAEQQASRPSVEFTSLAEATSRFRLTPGETIATRERLAHLAEAGVVERRPGVWQHAFDRQVFLHPPVDPWPFLSKIGAPTLVIHGERSAVMDGEAARRVAAAVQRGETTTVAGTYHHLVLDDPDGFAAAVLDWLGRTGR